MVLVLALAAGLWWSLGGDRATSPAVAPQRVVAEVAEAPHADSEPVERILLRQALPTPASEPAVGRLRIAGVVLDTDDCNARKQGVPAPGIEVRLTPLTGPDIDEHAIRTTISDSEGRFAFEVDGDGAHAGPWRLSVAGAKGRRSAHEKFMLDPELLARGGLVLARCPLESIAGTAETVAGEPLEGVAVRLGSGIGETVLSDAEGRFSLGIEFEDLLAEIEAEKPGWALVERLGGKQDEQGRRPIVRLVFARAATLEVRVFDAEGGPRFGEYVGVGIADDERFGQVPGGTSGGRLPAGRTDGAGRVTLAGCPAGLRLVVGGSGVSYPRVLGDRLVRGESSAAGAPLVLGPGETRNLELRLGRSLRVSGRVSMVDGRPAVGAMVTLRLRAHAEARSGETGSFVFTDEEARYAFDVAPETEPLEVELLAEAGEDGRLPHSMFQVKRPDALYVARVRRPWPVEPSATWEIDLVCARAPSIAGQVLDGDGRPTSADAELTPTGGGDPVRRRADRDGELYFSGLLEASYELVVHTHGRSARLSGLVPDAPPFTVRLDGPASARVVVRVSSTKELAQATVLSCELRPRAASSVVVPDLPARLVVDESLVVEVPMEWPASARGDFYGTAVGSTDRGVVSSRLGPIEGQETVLEIDGGLWWFGARGRASDGNALFPLTTGLMRVTPGEHLVEVHLVATGSVRGALVVELAPDERWLALARPGGPAIPFDVGADRSAAAVRCGTDGSFSWPMVPVGPLELRWGRREDLLAGRAAGTRALEVCRGETTTLEIGP